MYLNKYFEYSLSFLKYIVFSLNTFRSSLPKTAETSKFYFEKKSDFITNFIM